MNPRRILIVLMLLFAVIAGIGTFFEARGLREPLWWQVASTMLLNLSIFYWYYADSERHAFKRSRAWNVAIIVLSFIALPVYIVRRSARGTRLRALAWLVGCMVLVLVVASAGSVVGDLMA